MISPHCIVSFHKGKNSLPVLWRAERITPSPGWGLPCDTVFDWTTGLSLTRKRFCTCIWNCAKSITNNHSWFKLYWEQISFLPFLFPVHLCLPVFLRRWMLLSVVHHVHMVWTINCFSLVCISPPFNWQLKLSSYVSFITLPPVKPWKIFLSIFSGQTAHCFCSLRHPGYHWKRPL